MHITLLPIESRIELRDGRVVVCSETMIPELRQHFEQCYLKLASVVEPDRPLATINGQPVVFHSTAERLGAVVEDLICRHQDIIEHSRKVLQEHGIEGYRRLLAELEDDPE